MNVLISLNDNYVKYYSVMLESLFENNSSERIVIYIIKDKYPSASGIRRLNKIVERFENGILKLVNIEKGLLDRFKKFNLCEWPMEAYFRLFAPWILDESVERILYLDGDIIVNKDILPFYHMNLGNNMFAACEDVALSPYRIRLEKNDHDEACILLNSIQSLNKNQDREYFNAGVLLMDASQIRNKYTVNELIDFIDSINKYLKYPDQDILNFFFGDKICSVDPMLYNCQIGGIHYSKGNDIMRETCIMHFTGNRPWHNHYRIHYSSAIPGDIWWEYALKGDIVNTKEYRCWKTINILKTRPWMIIYDAMKKIGEKSVKED